MGNVSVPTKIILQSGELEIESWGQFTALAGANYVNVGGLPVLNNEANRVSVCASAGDAVQLPQAIPGLSLNVFNDGAQELAVFAGGTDIINGGSAGGYIAQMPNSYLNFCSSSAGAWECEFVGSGFLGNLPTQSGANGITAAGTTQGTATALSRAVNRVTTVAAGSGVVLPSIAGLKAATSLSITVMNAQGTNALKVYPAGTDAIEALGAGVAYSLAAATGGQAAKVATFISTIAGQWHLMLSSN